MSVVISGIGVHFPDRQVDNSYYIDYFDQRGKDIRKRLEKTGRDKRFIAKGTDETVVTMAVGAARGALEQADTEADELDAIVFSSGTPEYLAPINAVKVHAEIGAKEECLSYDMNSNCLGMVVAVEQIARVMQANPKIRKAMVVGSEQMSRFIKEDDEIIAPIFGDAACAVVLQQTDGEEGFIDSNFVTLSGFSDLMLFPKCGMSKIYDQAVEDEDKHVFWSRVSLDDGFKVSERLIRQVLESHDLRQDDVKKYFVSQVNKMEIEWLADALGEPMDKFVFVGDQVGYTGTSSPFIAFDYAVREKLVERGDLVVFWSLGIGYTSATVLMRY